METKTFLSADTTNNHVVIRYAHNDRYHSAEFRETSAAVEFYNEHLKPADQFQKFMVGAYENDAFLDTGEDRANGRASGDEWYIDPVKIAENAYVRQATDQFSDLTLSPEQTAALQQTVNKHGASKAITALQNRIDISVSDDELAEEVVQGLVTTTLEELSHAQSRYAHERRFAVTFPKEESRERMKDALDDTYDSHTTTCTDDGFVYTVDPYEERRKQDEFADAISDTLSASEKNVLQEHWQFLGDDREDWEETFFWDLAAYSLED